MFSTVCAFFNRPYNNSGDDCANVIKTFHKINGVRCVEDCTPFFATDKGEFTRMDIPLKLSEDELLSGEIVIEMDIIMKNLRSFCYKQSLYLRFTKKDTKIYALTGFNTDISDFDEHCL